MRILAVLTAMLAAAAPSFAQPAGAVSQFVTPSTPLCSTCLAGAPNDIFLDATGGKVMFPLPSSPRSFATVADFATFLQQNLNATPLYDSGSGKIIGVSGGLLQAGHSYYLDVNNAVQPITDPISAFIGGLWGRFTVAGLTYTTGLQGGSSPDAIIGFNLPTNVIQCKTNPTECIVGHSWNEHTLGTGLSDSVGIKVEQLIGGFQQSTGVCWWFIFPYPCSSSSGTNLLSLQGQLFYDQFLLLGTGPSTTQVAFTYQNTLQNVTDITYSKEMHCFGIPFTPITVCGGSYEFASSLVGACERDSSASIPSVGATADGRTIGCATPGVTCSSGYTLCQPNNVCSGLIDVQHCGSCTNQCPQGWSCGGAPLSCVPPPPPPCTPACAGQCGVPDGCGGFCPDCCPGCVPS